VRVDPTPGNEAQRGIESVADASVDRVAVPEVVRVVDVEPKSGPLLSVPQVVTPHGQAPHAGAEVLAPTEPRGLVCEVGAELPASPPPERIACGSQEPRPRFCEQVLLNSHDRHRRGRSQGTLFTSAHDEAAEASAAE